MKIEQRIAVISRPVPEISESRFIVYDFCNFESNMARTFEIRISRSQGRPPIAGTTLRRLKLGRAYEFQTPDELPMSDAEHGIPDFGCPFLVRKRGFVPAMRA